MSKFPKFQGFFLVYKNVEYRYIYSLFPRIILDSIIFRLENAFKIQNMQSLTVLTIRLNSESDLADIMFFVSFENMLIAEGAELDGAVSKFLKSDLLASYFEDNVDSIESSTLLMTEDELDSLLIDKVAQVHNSLLTKKALKFNLRQKTYY